VPLAALRTRPVPAGASTTGRADQPGAASLSTAGRAIPVAAELIAADRGEGELEVYDTLADAQLPPDIRRQVAAALDIQEIIHRDI